MIPEANTPRTPPPSDAGRSWEQAVAWLRAQPDQQELVLACYYDDPLVDAAERFYAGAEWRAVRDLLGTARGNVLDLGAGRGISSFAFAKDGWTTTALEPDSSELVGAGAIRALSAQSGLTITVVQQTGEQLPFPDSCFDLVYGRAVLHHARDLSRFCAEAARVMKPGGRFIATREHVLSRLHDLDAFLRHHPLHHLYGGENAYLLEQYRAAMEGAGIRLERVLNPYESEINLFPQTDDALRRRLARRLFLPDARWLPSRFIKWLGDRLHTPGRLYTFVGRKA